MFYRLSDLPIYLVKNKNCRRGAANDDEFSRKCAGCSYSCLVPSSSADCVAAHSLSSRLFGERDLRVSKSAFEMRDSVAISSNGLVEG